MSFLVYSSAGVLTLISLIHFYWIFGGRWAKPLLYPKK
ncbi:DUF3995 domain-containing protein [Gracilibacillus salitolerans]|uniref:DUF3995 domain-containing protein n=1 Tax=Gracilibacillus salitolerans TaxID=2663022 RepID=A0A5Q2TGH0_9BACI|nr:DUF3995 domain-containing protein [Gracilibacillus salitolerans]